MTAALGCVLLWVNAVRWRFRNFATSVFLLCYVPLFCVYPIIGRLLSGGAISIEAQNSFTFTDPQIYYIYQIYITLILTGCVVLTLISMPRANPGPTSAPVNCSPPFPLIWLLVTLGFGIHLYIYSTGLSVSELLIASRFEWFLNSNYSSPLSVIASYLIALAPALIYLCARQDKKIFLFIVLLLLIGYGALSKDRKWLIFIASGLLAAQYLKMNYKLKLSSGGLIWLSLFAVVLAFWQVARGVLFNAVINDEGDLASEVYLMMEHLLTRGDLPYYYNASVTAIHLNFNEGFSIPLGLLRRQLFFFLPVDFSFGLKIEDISAIFSDAVQGEDSVRRGNMPPGLIGLLVVSFEWWGGLIVALGIPYVLHIVDKLFRRQSGIVHIALISNFLSATLLLLRGDDSSATYFIIFTIIVLFIFKVFRQTLYTKTTPVARLGS